MFSDQEFSLAFAPVTNDPQLVMIPIDEENGILAVVKTYGLGQASCIAFAPATKLDRPFESYRPQFLRKTVTNDFSLRTGKWKSVELTNNNAVVLRNAAVKVLDSVEKMQPEAIKKIEMDRPTNISSAPDVACATYRADEHTPFEQALMHLMGCDFKKSAAHTGSNGDEATA